MYKIFTLFAFIVLFGSNAQNTYLHCGKIIDTKNGKVLGNHTIVISENKIVSISEGFQNPTNNEDKVYDLKNKTVLPGLVDMHVHIESETGPTK